MSRSETSDSHLRDEELMQKFMNGSEQAFNSLYDRYAGRVYSYLTRRVASKALVDEIFQEVFLKLTKSRHKFDLECHFAPWLFSIVHSSLVDVKRKERKHVSESLPDEIPQIEDSASHNDGDTNIEAIIGALSEKEKSILRLRYINDLSFESIAARTGYLASNIRQIISRSIKKLRGGSQ